MEWRLFIFISRESKWGTLKSAGNPRCAVPAESHSICTDWRRPGPAAALQVSPTSDTCQSVAILMNRPHSNNGPAKPRELYYAVSFGCVSFASLLFQAPAEKIIFVTWDGGWSVLRVDVAVCTGDQGGHVAEMKHLKVNRSYVRVLESICTI